MIISPHKENHLLAIPGELGKGNFAKLSQFPGFWKWQERNLVFRATGANLLYVLNNWPDAEWIGGAEKFRKDFLIQQGLGEQIVRAKSDPAIVPDDKGYKYKRQPMDHQRKAFSISRDTKAFGLFMEQGTGKTKVTIDTACYLFQKGEIDALIVIAWPNGVHRNWVEYELPEDMSVPYMADFWSSNHKTLHRKKAFDKILGEKKKLRVFTFNIEAFVSEAAKGMLLKMLGQWKCLLVIDQSASIKNPQAKRTKFLVDKAAALASFRRVLDGQPVAEGADELYSQFKFLDPWIIGHDTWTAFRAEFCEVGFFNEIKGYKNLDELRRRIDGHCYRVLSRDCQDLPPRIYKKWKFDLTPGERRIFEELESQDLAFFKDSESAKLATGHTQEAVLMEKEGEATGETCSETLEEHRALIKNMRLQQISSGWWPGEEFKAIEEGDKLPGRAQALMALLQQSSGKCLIFARFRADLDLLQKLLGKEAVSFHGGIKDDDRDEAKRRFMRDPKVKFFLGQPRSAGVGHTLTAAENVIFYSNDHSLRLREECEKRAHRTGLKTKLFVWDLVASDTQDEKIVKSLREKKKLADVILKDPESFFLNYEK